MRTSPLLLSLGIFLSLSAPSIAAAAGSARFQTYTSTDMGFSIQYPTEWQMEEGEEQVTFSPSIDELLAAFVVKAVLIDEDKRHLSLQELTELVITGLEDADMTAGRTRLGKLARNPATFTPISMDFDGDSLVVEFAFVRKGDILYQVTSGALKPQLRKYKGAFRKMQRSFVILPLR